MRKDMEGLARLGEGWLYNQIDNAREKIRIAWLEYRLDENESSGKNRATLKRNLQSAVCVYLGKRNQLQSHGLSTNEYDEMMFFDSNLLEEYIGFKVPTKRPDRGKDSSKQ